MATQTLVSNSSFTQASLLPLLSQTCPSARAAAKVGFRARTGLLSQSQRSVRRQNFVVRAEGSDDDEDFESRLASIRRGGSGTGRKAEVRKARKAGELDFGIEPQSQSQGGQREGGKASIVLPPTPIQDPVSGGLPIELGFNSYSERLNGRLAGLGFVAILAVELASGRSLLSYHDPATIGVQIYFIIGCAALYVKWERERKGVWPK